MWFGALCSGWEEGHLSLYGAARALSCEMMEAYPVSTLVNSPENDSRECAEPFRDSFF